MSAAQGFAVHDGLLHPHLRHCSSTAPAVRQLSSAVYTTDHHAVCLAGLPAAAAAACNLPDYFRDATSSFNSFCLDLFFLIY